MLLDSDIAIILHLTVFHDQMYKIDRACSGIKLQASAGVSLFTCELFSNIGVIEAKKGQDKCKPRKAVTAA